MTNINEAFSRHRLRVERIELLGGSRVVDFRAGLNLVRGDITTGKTTLIRLIRALLGAIPRHLPPEAAALRALRGEVVLGQRAWKVYRPMVSTADAPIEVAADASMSAAGETTAEPIALRLPATGQGGYGEFVLTQLGLPIVSVPRARREPTTDLSPVTINDWLLYCIVTGDELDTQVFGHRDPFRDLKRRWVFEIAYGLYDEELARLAANLRQIDLKIRASESEAEVIRQFLSDTALGNREDLDADLQLLQERLVQLHVRAKDLQSASESEAGGEIASVRAGVLDSRRSLDELRSDIRQHEAQLRDLSDLTKQLTSLSKRLTRAIVADEWMIDFDFVVCPRCGHDLDSHRESSPICYLCLQPEPTNVPNRDALIQEQDRVTYQIAETEQLVDERFTTLAELRRGEAAAVAELARASSQLEILTSEFVSARAAELQSVASEVATTRANLDWTQRYLELIERQAAKTSLLDDLKAQKEAIEENIENHRSGVSTAEENIQALEERMLDYLTRLHVPQLGELLTVRINRQNYLPEVSTRTFDELSSQGLKTLVNVAHALAHHTVAIDRNLEMPGLLVLDGVSANSGKEGFEFDRIVDMYELFDEVASAYGDELQLIVVDNDVPAEVNDKLASAIMLTLSQSDRLVGGSDDPSE
jgi:predicted  nucleic acid-binding Zn-ribbon protein